MTQVTEKNLSATSNIRFVVLTSQGINSATEKPVKIILKELIRPMILLERHWCCSRPFKSLLNAQNASATTPPGLQVVRFWVNTAKWKEISETLCGYGLTQMQYCRNIEFVQCGLSSFQMFYHFALLWSSHKWWFYLYRDLVRRAIRIWLGADPPRPVFFNVPKARSTGDSIVSFRLKRSTTLLWRIGLFFFVWRFKISIVMKLFVSVSSFKTFNSNSRL